ncbi:hypothetical protein NMG60_11001901 [Bertholletia excelsa]
MEGPSFVNGGDCCVMDLPPGFRFHPTDEEIITHYLKSKVVNNRFTAIAVGEVDLNKCEPWDLPKKAKLGQKEWYFFCHRDRKYPTGMRTNRATRAGYWKATGKDKEIYRGRTCLIGMKKTLVFYKGRAPKGEKTNWVMHEYRLEGESSYFNFSKTTKDEWVVCRVFHKNQPIRKNGSITGLTRMNSYYYDDDPLEYYSSLPPLVDPHYYSNNERPASSGFTDDDEEEIKGKGKGKAPAAASSARSSDGDFLSYLSTSLLDDDHQLQEQHDHHEISDFTSRNNIHHDFPTYQTFPTHPTPDSIFHSQNQPPNYPMFPFQASSSLKVLDLTSLAVNSINHRSTSDIKRQCNRSMITVSQDTTGCTDMTTETSSGGSKKDNMAISSRSNDESEDNPSVGPLPDLQDYLWNC